MNVMRFGVDRKDAEQAARFGRYYWMAGLADGRELSFMADRVELVDGHLRAIHVHDDTETMTLALPPGSWVHFYSASVMDGSPVCVAHLPKPVSSR